MLKQCKRSQEPYPGTVVPGRIERLFVVLLLPALFFAPVGCGTVRPDRNEETVVINEAFLPAGIQSGQLAPGLSVLYFYDYYRHIMNMPQGERLRKKGKPGPPLLQLNHRFGKDVEVFDSGQSQGVGMVLEGFLHLDQPGTYIFQAKTNDGFELYLAGRLLISDPGVHGDRLSKKAGITVTGAGWFPVHMKYFQRKGTAALTLMWQQPGDSGMTVVPGEAYAHLPGGAR